MVVRRIDDIAPDGLLLLADWDRMRVGSSVFVPCINTTAALKQVREIFDRRGWKARVAIRPENAVWGVRIWRIA